MPSLSKSIPFTFNGTIQELLNQIQVIDDPNIESLGNYEFVLRAKTSIGVAQSGGVSIFDGIKVFVEVESKNESLQKLKLKCKPRIELYFLSSIFILFLIGSIMNGLEFIYLLSILIGAPLIISAFHFLYRTQENAVIDRFVGQLDLKKEHEPS
ncbi:MAG: hypothetical protein ACPGLV_15535 [Bacteroidia bacterium]